MNRVPLSVAWYRFGATFRRRWTGYLAIVVLVGALGGLSMGSIAGARRTQASYPTFLASTNPSDLNVAVYNPETDGGPGPSLLRELEHLPDVKRVRTVVSPQIVPLAANGAPRLNTLGAVVALSSLDGEFFDQDRLAATSGRLADPTRADEIMMTSSAATLLGVHLGEIVPLGIYVPSQATLPGFGTAKVPPVVRVPARLVGIVTLNNQVVQDDIDRAYGFTIVTPALLREAVARSPQEGAAEGYAIQLDHGGEGVTKVEQDIIKVIPPHLTYEFHVTARVVDEVTLAIKPESIALGSFGIIAGLVALVLAIQAISRQLQWGGEERRVLRALGAGPAVAAGDGLIGVIAAIVLGTLVALAVAVALSPLSPLGPVRPVYPDRGVAFDGTVLGIGCAVLLVGLGAAAVGLAYRFAPSRSLRIRGLAMRRLRVTRATESTGLPVAGVVGVRFALESGEANAVPVRSALMGTVLAIALLVSTLTFASGLHTLVSSPRLYGWNWSYMLNPTNAVPPAALKLLDDDRDVAAWTGIATYTSAELDGETVPFLITDPHPTVAPPILSGHGLEAGDQIVLGSATLALLGKRVGETVMLSYGSPRSAPLYVPPRPVRIVGTATFPAVGYSSFVADHTSMGTGALISTSALPSSFVAAFSESDPNLRGPQLVFVRLRAGVSPSAGRANLEKIAAVANRVFAAADPNGAGNSVSVLGVQRPVQIVNYKSIGSTPVVLAVGLALGAIVALTVTLFASVRHRRRDLALLKALGFTPRQLSAVVAWQSSVTALVGVIVGIPVGIIVGRQLWTLFARNINAVPDPTVPVLSVILVGIGALVFANVVAALPGQFAARTPTALVLRAE